MWLFERLFQPKGKEVVEVVPPRLPMNMFALPQHTSMSFRELLLVLDATQIEFPHLKSVVAAQWALESGWGTSKLATQHHNYAGAKWRAWCKPFGKPVQYDAWDGPDTYVSFNTDADFIAAYWKRLDVTEAYSGWRLNTATPEAFIRHIGPPWVAVSPEHGAAYVKRILKINEDIMRTVFRV